VGIGWLMKGLVIVNATSYVVHSRSVALLMADRSDGRANGATISRLTMVAEAPKLASEALLDLLSVGAIASREVQVVDGRPRRRPVYESKGGKHGFASS
jgi:hypothetical protein